MWKVGRLLLLGLCGVSGCGGRDVFLDLRDPAGTSTPTATRQPTPTVTPTAIPTPTPDFGDGHDGALNVTATVTINECRGVVSASGNTVLVTDAAPFPGGRRILVHQAQSDFANVGDIADVTTATMGAAGLWEIARVQSVAGTTLTLGTTLGASYSSAGTARAHACAVPEYTDVTVAAGGTIEASDWDGASGGVVAFYANGIAQIDGRLDADSEGFRGGDRSQNGGGNGVTLDTTNSTDGGGRGEGLDGRSLGANGRGHRANGAGGGNAHNAGGGGGGGAGRGGSGGFQGEGNPQEPNTRGRSGRAVLLTGAERLVLGGGGGGGQQDDGGGARGARGGGAIVFFANDLRGTGTVDADAAYGSDATGVDGAGGGGAGGMIVIHVATSAFLGELSAEGGGGGTAGGNSTTDNYASGPGGGGGGGWIVAPAVVTTSTTIEVNGGRAGYLQDESSNDFGSTAGDAGVVVNP